MRLSGRRESNNVKDRRCVSGAAKASVGGIGGVMVIALFTLLSGGNLGDVVSNVFQSGSVSEKTLSNDGRGQREVTEEEQKLAKLSRQILAGTEEVWSRQFKKMGRKYTAPTLVLFSGSVNSACGRATAAARPFYCSADQKLYLDLSFLMNMKSEIGAGGDFACAYVIAHEVGHHVEYLLGELGRAREQMSVMNTVDANRMSVELELLADYYAGVWAHYDNKWYDSIEDGDMEETLRRAEVVGGNCLQEKTRGYSPPESFTHGIPAQRAKWFRLGLETGDMTRTTFDEI